MTGYLFTVTFQLVISISGIIEKGELYSISIIIFMTVIGLY